jgi:hypothetical protein
MASTVPPQPCLGVRAKGTLRPRPIKAARLSLPHASPLLPLPPAPALPDLAAESSAAAGFPPPIRRLEVLPEQAAVTTSIHAPSRTYSTAFRRRRSSRAPPPVEAEPPATLSSTAGRIPAAPAPLLRR